MQCSVQLIQSGIFHTINVQLIQNKQQHFLRFTPLPQRDEPRINFLYHQAIRSVLSEDVVPTETESLEFAAYQFAVEQATRNPPKLARPLSPGIALHYR